MFRRLQRERDDREHQLWQLEMQKEAEKAMEMERLEIEKRRLQQVIQLYNYTYLISIESSSTNYLFC